MLRMLDREVAGALGFESLAQARGHDLASDALDVLGQHRLRSRQQIRRDAQQDGTPRDDVQVTRACRDRHAEEGLERAVGARTILLGKPEQTASEGIARGRRDCIEAVTAELRGEGVRSTVESNGGDLESRASEAARFRSG